MISEHEAKGDWKFLYIDENSDRWTKDTRMSPDRGSRMSIKSKFRNFGGVDCYVRCLELEITLEGLQT